MEEKWTLDKRPHTRTKLAIFNQYFDIWLAIWNKQGWAGKHWYYIDLFAGRGFYTYKKENKVYGSPLIFLDQVHRKICNPTSPLHKGIKIRMFLVEQDKEYYARLEREIKDFLTNHETLSPMVNVRLFHDDCNRAIDSIIPEITDDQKSPLLAIIDPWGIKIKSTTVDKIINLNNPKDIFFNYIEEGVRRVSGVVKKSYREAHLDNKSLATIKSFYEFIGHDESIKEKSNIEILESFSRVFSKQELKVTAFDMKYPDRKDVIYYLLFASKKGTITKIIRKIFAKQKESIYGPSLYGTSFYEQGLLSFED